jgi:2-C-methyl-D-erythritol 4-phosphate cytidylyltransferase/2-C-methyl-D-erythritol 2,4-cyclodiphosphate synthase
MQSPANSTLPLLPPSAAMVLLCGGRGTRMQQSVEDKILAHLNGLPVVSYSIRAWQHAAPQSPLVLVYRDQIQRERLQSILTQLKFSAEIYWAAGGAERQDSVRNGLSALPPSCTHVFIHDAARPMLSAHTLQRMGQVLASHYAVACARPTTDTILYAEKTHTNESIEWKPLPRTKLWSMETPQAFQRTLLEEAHQRIIPQQQVVTDDVSALALCGHTVTPLIPDHPNPKLTHPSDLPLIASLMSTQTPSIDIRIGQGFDIHQFAEDRKLILGGVEIPHSRGLKGHSDADCLLHALADAILGACALPDIGYYFPNNDPSIAGIDSGKIVQTALTKVQEQGWKLVNCDITLLAQEPKIAPWIGPMKEKIGQLTGLTTDRIGIKATTLEHIGGLGRAEGIACMANVLLGK